MFHLWLISLLLLPSVTTAQSRWTLTTADFRSRQVELISLDDAGATVKDGQEEMVAWDALLALERETSAAQQTGAGATFVLHLSGGDQIRGEPLKLEGETLHWKSPAVGAMGISLRQVSALVRANRAAPAIDQNRTEDLVLLANGDSVRGILSDVSGKSLSIQSGENAVPVPLDSVAAVLFASTAGAGAAPPAGRAFRLRLDDGSTITAPSLKSAGQKLVLTLGSGDSRELPLASVHGIEQLNGPVSWLSSRPPGENVQTPLLETSRPARMDRTVTGKPIRFGGRTFARGIGVAPYSRMTWPLGEGAKQYAAFRTQYAIDGTGPYADVTVRIKLDDQIVHEKKNVIAGVLSPVVIVPLNRHSRSLTLEVDWGENYGVQDRLNWIEPALLKSSAIPQTPTPASVPATTRSTGS